MYMFFYFQVFAVRVKDKSIFIVLIDYYNTFHVFM